MVMVHLSFAQTAKNLTDLEAQNQVIRNETVPGANTKDRIANMYKSIYLSSPNIFETYANPSWISSLAWSKITGAPSFESVLTFSSPLVRSVNTISIPAATSSVNGYLSSSDWTLFNNKLSTGTITDGVTAIDGDGSNTLNIGTNTPFNQINIVANTLQISSDDLSLTDTGGSGVIIQDYLTLSSLSSAPAGAVNGSFWYNSTSAAYQVKIGGNVYPLSIAPTIVANATDANFTATVNGIHNILDGVATANRVITIPSGSNGDVMKFYNTEDAYVWSFTGATVYLADRVTVVTEMLYNVPCFMEKIDGRWIITN